MNLFKFTDWIYPASRQTDVLKDEEKLTFIVNIPGLTKDDVTILFEDDVLTIETKEVKTDGEFLIKERNTSGFKREFTISENIDEENIKANVKDGLLTIILPIQKNLNKKTVVVE